MLPPVLPIAIIGFGKIARDQHVPAIRADSRFNLVATVDPHAELEGVAHYRDVEALLAADTGVKAVAICTPPSVRHRVARVAIAAGLHVLLEKPPGETVDEVVELERKIFASGIPDRNGFWSPAVSAYSIPASTRCRS